MSPASYGATSRRPVYSGNRRVPGLYQRTLTDGHTVYDVALRLGGKVRRHRLEAQTKTDAISELRALQTDYDRGETYRSPAASVTVQELTTDYLAHLETRVGHRDPRQRRSARTVVLYRQRLEQHICKELGQRPATSLTVVDIRRLVLALNRKRLSFEHRHLDRQHPLRASPLRHQSRRSRPQPCRDLDRDDRPGSARATEPRYLDTSEVNQLLAQLSGHVPAKLQRAARSQGLRISETLGLRWRDIDFDAGRPGRELDSSHPMARSRRRRLPRARQVSLSYPRSWPKLALTESARPNTTFASYTRMPSFS